MLFLLESDSFTILTIFTRNPKCFDLLNAGFCIKIFTVTYVCAFDGNIIDLLILSTQPT